MLETFVIEEVVPIAVEGVDLIWVRQKVRLQWYKVILLAGYRYHWSGSDIVMQRKLYGRDWFVS